MGTALKERAHHNSWMSLEQDLRAMRVRKLLKERNANVNLIIFKCAGQEENRRTKLVD